jgi:hypothetical protein
MKNKQTNSKRPLSLFVLVFLLIVYPVSESFSDEAQNYTETFTGKAFDKNGALFYVEKHDVTYEGKRSSRASPPITIRTIASLEHSLPSSIKIRASAVTFSRTFAPATRMAPKWRKTGFAFFENPRLKNKKKGLSAKDAKPDRRPGISPLYRKTSQGHKKRRNPSCQVGVSVTAGRIRL